MDDLNHLMLNAAFQNDLETVERLVLQGADINYNDRYGNCAVFSAAWEGNIEALELFYSLGASIDLGDKSLLCNAAFNAQPGSVKWLIEKGQDANYTLETGENAFLHYVERTTKYM